MLIDSLNTNIEIKELLKFIVESFLKLSKELPDYISELEIQSYLENNVSEIMQTNNGEIQIIEQVLKLNSIFLSKKKPKKKFLMKIWVLYLLIFKLRLMNV